MLTAAPVLACHSAQQVPGGPVLPSTPPPFPGTMGTHRAAPGPGPCQTPSVPPPLCLLFPHPAVSVRLCACLSVPHPSSPGHCLHLCPPWGVPYPCAPMKVAALGWEHPMADPRSGAGLTSRPHLGAMLGWPWGRCLTHTTSLASLGWGGLRGAQLCRCQNASARCVPQFPLFCWGELGVTACQVL